MWWITYNNAVLFWRERQFVVSVVLWFVCDYQRDQREIYGVSFVLIDRVLLRVIFPQMAQMTQRNTASCIISQRKTCWCGSWGYCCLGFCLRKSARSAGDIGVSFVLIDWVLLRVILPQISQMTQRNTASCIISQRKTGWCGSWGYCCLGFVCDYLRDQRETYWGFICADRLSTLAWIFSRR